MALDARMEATLAAGAASLLKVEGLSVGIRGPEGVLPILEDVDFTLESGRVVGVIGESGSGKTVLSRALANWLPRPLEVTAGRLLFHGQDLAHLPRAQAAGLRGRRIGYIGSNPTSSLDPTLPVGDQIVEKLQAVEAGIGAKAAKERVLDLLAAVHIPTPRERFNEYPFQFSGGMMQRAMIVDALVSRPDFLICDNITQPLDVTVAAQILRIVRELRDEFRTGIVFVSSSLPVAREVADELLVLSGGRVVEHRPTHDLIAAPAHDYTQRLMRQLPRIWSVDDPPPAQDSGPEPVLRVRGVSKTYTTRKRGSFAGVNHVRAVRDVSFDIFAGENFGIVGESGCGKSTLTRLLSWLEEPDTGSIEFEGQDLKAAGRRQLFHLRSRFQLLLQDPYNSLPPRTTVGRMILEPLLIHGRGGSGAREKVLAAMAEVGLPAKLYDALPIGLSAGQRQRIAIARALVLEPRLLILDETLSALDPAEQSRLLELFAKLQAEHGLTYIYISHDLAMVRRTCNRIAVMYLGEVVELSENRKLFFDPGHPYTRALLSAAPTLEEKPYDSREVLLDGEPPSPIDLPPGCSFRSRCPRAFGRCATESPRLPEAGSRDRAACFLAESA